MDSSERIDSFRDLKVWQKGMDLAEMVYQLTNSFPKHELYGLTSQLRRACTSVPANVSEGHSRGTTKEYLRFLSIAIGSLSEVETFLELAKRFSYGAPETINQILQLGSEERRMLRGLQRSLRAKLDS